MLKTAKVPCFFFQPRPIVFSRLGHSMGVFHLNFIPEKAFIIPEKVSTKYQKKFHEILTEFQRITKKVSTKYKLGFNQIPKKFQPNTNWISTKYQFLIFSLKFQPNTNGLKNFNQLLCTQPFRVQWLLQIRQLQIRQKLPYLFKNLKKSGPKTGLFWKNETNFCD